MKFDFKKLLPHVIAIVAFLIVSVIYCKPALDGKVVSQSDMIQWKGMSKDAENYKERHGVYPQWTNGMFSGMPTFSIAFNNNAAIAGAVPYYTGLMLPVPILYFFLGCVAFYFLSQVLRVNPYIGMLGAFAFAFCSYDPILITAGHHTKLITIAQMPALLGALILTYQKKYWLGGALTAWFTAGLISHSHLQMVYYFLMIALFMTGSYVILWIRTKQIKHLLIAGIVTTAAAGAGVLANLITLRPTAEYAKYTMRGGTALAGKGTNSSKVGLDTGYAFQYSYGIPETFSLLVPNIYGGETKSFDETSKLYETIGTKGLPQETTGQIMQSLPQYWGNQPFTGGPVYVGAVICFLFVVSLVSLKSHHKWWILTVTLFAIVLAWGRNLPGLNTWLFENLPLYNKFRAPTQSLAIPQLTFPLLAILALQHFFFGAAIVKVIPAAVAGPVKKDAVVITNPEDKLRWKQLLISGGITAGIMLLIFILAQSFSYRNLYNQGAESQLQMQLMKAVPGDPTVGKDVINAALADRKGLLMGDFWRSLLFVSLAFGAMAAFAKRKLAARWAVLLLLLISSFDLLQTGRRYLNEDNFVVKEEGDVEGSLANSGIIPIFNSIIEKDKGLHYRVFNEAMNPYNEAYTAYFLRSVGGYHPAKLSLYQDLIENQLSKGNMTAFNMLDTKYFIKNDGQVQTNPDALGAAWFAKEVRFVDGAVAEMKALDTLNVRDAAIIDKSFQAQVKEISPSFDSAAIITLTKYDNDLIEYSLRTSANQFAVLSEIYYPAGWKAFVDGTETPIIKANYLLRAVNIPANAKKLELKFEPEVYKSSYQITGIMNYLLVVILLGGLFMGWREWKKNNENAKG